ncbi:MAG TPA: hypothetical protein VFB96_14265 [Pirellulaceae bacterium]|nr:hypothetical protein [Pirellulaceae bacterium]
MRFTIRDLLWLTVVVALGVAWGNNYLALRDEQRTNVYLRRAIENAGFVPSGGTLGPDLIGKEQLARMLEEQAQAKKLPKN